MPDPDAAWNRPPPVESGWRRFTASLPMRTALLAVATVWVLGAVWSFEEQTAFASVKGFAFPFLLPLVIDGFAVAMAGVAWAASLDARPAISARLATVLAVAASSASNGAWAYLRTDNDLAAVLLGVAVPITANLAFEVLLAELRRQVQRRRGLPAPVAIPYPRLIRLVLAPLQTFGTWRTMVLEITAMEHTLAPRTAAAAPVVEPPELATEQATPAIQPPVATEVAPAAAQHPPSPAAAVSRATLAAQPSHAARPLARVAPSQAPGGQGQGGEPEDRRPGSRRRDLEAVPAAAPRRPRPARPTGVRADADRRPVDPRVEQLAQHLATTEDAGEFTGEMVGPLLKIDVAPRTGRRLLGLARELLSQRAQAEGDGHDPELSVIGSR